MKIYNYKLTRHCCSCASYSVYSLSHGASRSVRASVSVRAIRLLHRFHMRQVAICWCVGICFAGTLRVTCGTITTHCVSIFQFTHLSSTRLTRTTRTGTEQLRNEWPQKEGETANNIIFIHTTKPVDATTTSAALERPKIKRTGATAVGVQSEIIIIYL